MCWCAVKKLLTHSLTPPMLPLLPNSITCKFQRPLKFDFTIKVQYMQIPRQPIYCQNPLLAHSITYKFIQPDLPYVRCLNMIFLYWCTRYVNKNTCTVFTAKNTIPQTGNTCIIPKVQMRPMMFYKIWSQGYTDKSAAHISNSCRQVYWYINLIIHFPVMTIKLGGIQNIILLVRLRRAQYWRYNEHSSNNVETNRRHSNIQQLLCNPVTHKKYKKKFPSYIIFSFKSAVPD